MLTAVSALIVFGVLIGIHEAGHLIAAKAVGVTVFEFAIGMGPKLFSFTKGGTKYSLRLFPIGGYCRMDGEDERSENEGALCNKSVLQRLLVIAAGAIMNILLGFVIYVFCTSLYSDAVTTNRIGSVIPDSPAFAAELEAGDKIIKINGNRVYNSQDVNLEMMKAGYGNGFSVTVKRNGGKLTKTVVPSLYIKEYEEDGEVLGGYFADENTPSEIKERYGRYLMGFTFATEQKTVLTVLKSAALSCGSTVKIVLYSLRMLVTGQVGLNDVSGPVGIVGEIGNSARAGLLSLLSLTSMITINLGVFNLLPVPALDGGRIFFLLVELVRRKPIPPEREGLVHFIGLAALMIFMLVVTANDVFKLIR